MRWRSSIQHHVTEQLPLYIFVSVLFLSGVVFGAMLVNSLSLEQNQEINRYLSSFFHMLDQGGAIDSSDYFKEAFGSHLKWFLFIWVLGLSVIGLPLILVLDFLKGVLIGFTAGFFVGQLSWKGMLFALLSVAPQNLVLIPAILIMSVAAISFSLHFIRNRLILRKSGKLGQEFARVTFLLISFIGVVFLVSMFEAYLSPVLMEKAIPLLLQS